MCLHPRHFCACFHPCLSFLPRGGKHEPISNPLSSSFSFPKSVLSLWKPYVLAVMIGTFFYSLSPILLWCSHIQLTCCSRGYLACLLLCLYKSQPVCESLFQTHLCLLPSSSRVLSYLACIPAFCTVSVSLAVYQY